MPNFILMLTKDDRTVINADQAYEQVRDAPLNYVGFKDVGLPLEDLRTLSDRIHMDGRKVMFEVVSTTRESEVAAVRTGMAIGADYILGGRHPVDVIPLIQDRDVQYFPFCGHTVGHPTQLTGSIDSIVADARCLAAMNGVDGLDLLSYRFAGDAELLTRNVVQAVSVPVIAAGSIDRQERVRAMCAAGVWGFTVGSALFDGRFVENLLRQQVDSLVQMEGVTTRQASG